MNALRPTHRDVAVPNDVFPPAPPRNDRYRARPISDNDPFTRGYRRLLPRLRAACARYADLQDVGDLVQDVMVIAARSPARLAQSDTRTLSWLIGIAKRCAPAYGSETARCIPLDQLLAGESGNDLEGREIYEDVTELRAESWGIDD